VVTPRKKMLTLLLLSIAYLTPPPLLDTVCNTNWAYEAKFGDTSSPDSLSTMIVTTVCGG